METASEHAEPLVHAPTAPTLDAPRTLARRARDRAAAAIYSARFAIGVYLATRALLLLVAFVNGTLRHHAFTHELSQWDGLWYRDARRPRLSDARLARPDHARLLPGLPGHRLGGLTRVRRSDRALARSCRRTIAGVIVAGIGGLVATVLVQRLATGWWGEHAGRKAVLIFCLFPGSVVFSMVYAEGVMLALAAGCILALQKRRWVLAGALAAVATATEPEALVLVVVCAVSAAARAPPARLGDRSARRSLIAPALSLVGVGAFAGFLWIWTGSPFASFIAQRDGWSEKTDVARARAPRPDHRLARSRSVTSTIRRSTSISSSGWSARSC